MKIKGKIILLGIIIVIIIIGASLVGYYFYNVYWPANDYNLEREFVIEKGQGSDLISKNLKKAGIIKSTLVFEIYLWYNKKDDSLQAGDYKLRTNMSVKELARQLTVGGVTNEREIKIIEGWDNRDIADYFDSANVTSRDEFLAKTKNRGDLQKEYEFLQNAVTLEGYLFPDTYRIFNDATIDDIIQKMLNNFDKKLTSKLRGDIIARNKNINEIIIMASIIEQEVKEEGDRRHVADIFYKRLKTGMPLQADSTVNYVTRKKTPQASYKDIEVDSLYNTYKYKGLPPGPICNPGLDSIMAAIYPSSNDYWFFLTTEDSTVVYSKTAEEHATNKAKFLD